MSDSYQLLDSGDGRKLERFGEFVLDRPCSQAVWRKSENLWESADARFTREGGQQWEERRALPEEWIVEIVGISFKLKRTPFGHVGLFPEQADHWEWIQQRGASSLLNLFGYSGGVSLAAARGGGQVCHVDASSGMVDWARENAALNDRSSIRWIVDDARKFCLREVRRERRYDAVVLDPPSFGRGAKGEVFKIEEELPALLELCARLLSETPSFVLLSCHTPGYTPLVLENLLRDVLPPGQFARGEMVLEGARPVPSGSFCRWTP